jgi:hypothetical protein
MSDDERKLRAEYLCLSCCCVADKFTNSIIDILKEEKIDEDSNIREIVLKEVGILFRFWTTHAIWEALIQNENDAKWFNLYLFQLFNSGFNIPKDGSDIRHAEISGTEDEAKELGRKICNALNRECAITMLKINIGISCWIEVVLKYAKDALELPIEQIKSMVEEIKH